MTPLPCTSTPASESVLLLGLVLAIGLGFLSMPLPAQQTKASDGFEEVAAAPSEMDDLRQFLDLHLKLGNSSEAETYANRILARNPKDVDALGALLGINLKRGNASAAVSYAKRYRAVRPGGESDALYASALRLNRQPQEALAVMQQRYTKVAKGSHFPQLLELCYCYYDVGEIEKARDCFIKVRDDKRFSAKERGEAVKEIAAIQRQDDIREAYLAIEQRELKKARAIANDLVGREKKPNRDVTALVAVLDADEHGKVKEALVTFEKLRATHKGPEPFPYQSTYAVLLLDQGRYAEAEAAAAESARAKSPFLTAEDARGRRDTLRMVREFSRATMSAKGTYQDQSEGRAYRGKLIASMPLKKKRTRIGVEYQFNELDFDTKTPGADETDYHGLLATVAHQFTPRLSGHAAAGAIAGNFAYRAAVRMSRPTKEDFVEVSFAGGQRPTDTMTLEAFGAEENRASIKGSLEVPANRRIRLRGEAFVREIDLDHPLVNNLGDGWGARWEAEYLFYKFQRTVVSAAYVGAWEKFDYSGDAQERIGPGAPGGAGLLLVDDDLHRHGIELRGSAPVGDDLMAHAELGAGYRFDDKQMVYNISGGLEWWISEVTRLTAEAAYYTSGMAGNSGSGYFEGHLGVSSSF